MNKPRVLTDLDVGVLTLQICKDHHSLILALNFPEDSNCLQTISISVKNRKIKPVTVKMTHEFPDVEESWIYGQGLYFQAL